MDAIDIVNDKAIHDLNRCIGCGLGISTLIGMQMRSTMDRLRTW
jgi:hypothetical protein